MGEADGNTTASARAPIAPGLIHLGFLTIQQEQGAWLGGYLVTNAWARPLEFRLTSAVQPSRVQQILYGPNLEPHLVADLIAKTLLDKTAVSAQVVVCDHPHGCLLAGKVDSAMTYLAADGTPEGFSAITGLPEWASRLRIQTDDREGCEATAHVLGCIPMPVDLSEPFQRLREAMQEARRLGGALPRAAG